jgi:hypothetical protein
MNFIVSSPVGDWMDAEYDNRPLAIYRAANSVNSQRHFLNYCRYLHPQ